MLVVLTFLFHAGLGIKNTPREEEIVGVLLNDDIIWETDFLVE